MRDGHRDKEVEFAKVVEERDQLYDTFEGAVRAIQQKSDFRWGGWRTGPLHAVVNAHRQQTSVS